MLRVGDVVAKWYSEFAHKELKAVGCCNVVKTMNAWGPTLCVAHSRTLAAVMSTELSIPHHKRTLLKLLIATASRYCDRVNNTKKT